MYNSFYNGTPNYNFAQPQQLIRVNGIDGAKAYQMTPNSTVALFDGNDDIMYIKSTDGAGFPSIRKFQFVEIPDNPVTISNSEDYVTRKEFEELKEMVSNGKFVVREQTATE